MITRQKITRVIISIIAILLTVFSFISLNNKVFAASELDGKSVLIDGASVARGVRATSSGGWYSYGDYLEDEYSMNVTNISVSGAGYLQNSNPNKVLQNHLTDDVKSKSYDYIFLRAPYNGIKASTDLNTVAAAVEEYIKTVVNNKKWANAKIGLIITPHPDYSRTNLDQTKSEQYINLVREICNRYSVSVLDLYDDNSMTIDGENGSFDGRHPAKKLQKKIGKKVAKWAPTIPTQSSNKDSSSGTSGGNASSTTSQSQPKTNEPSTSGNTTNDDDNSGTTAVPNTDNTEPETPKEKCVETAILGENHKVCGDAEGSTITYIIGQIMTFMMVGIGILAVIGIMVFGIQYMTAAGNEAATTKAKRRMLEIVIGVAAYVLLYAVLSWLVPGFHA